MSKEQFNIKEEFIKIKSLNALEKEEKLDEFLRLQIEQRVETASFVADVVDKYKENYFDDSSDFESFLKTWSAKAHWTFEQELTAKKSLSDIKEKHFIFKSIKESGLSDNDLFKEFIQKPDGNVLVREVPGGLAFITDNEDDYLSLVREDNPFKLKESLMLENENNHSMGQYIANYRGRKKVSQPFSYAVIAVNGEYIKEVSKKSKFNEQEITELTVAHETYHLWHDLYLSKEFFNKDSLNTDKNIIFLMDHLQNEALAHLAEQTLNTNYISESLINMYIDHILKHVSSEEMDNDLFKKAVLNLKNNINNYISAAHEIINYFDDINKSLIILRSESMDKWPRLYEQIKKYYKKSI